MYTGRALQMTTGNYLIGHWSAQGDVIHIETSNPSVLSGGNNLSKRVYGLEYLTDASLVFRGTGNDINTTAGSNSISGLTTAINVGSANTESSDVYVQAYVEFDTALTTAQRQDVEGFLAHKLGIEADLPAGHPHKSAAPTTSITWELLATTKGRFKDTSGDLGTAGQVLSSTAAGHGLGSF